MRCRQVLKALGVTKGDKSIARSHIVIGKGGAIEDIQIGISPGAKCQALSFHNDYSNHASRALHCECT